jgi:hypothetical protein
MILTHTTTTASTAELHNEGRHEKKMMNGEQTKILKR